MSTDTNRTTEQRLALLLIVLALSGCARDPVSTDHTDNQSVSVDKLFTHEGCSVYRFYDAGHYHYWADCRGDSIESSQTCGRNCTRTEGVPTP